MKIVPLQLKIKSVYGKLHELRNNITSLFIESNDKELFRKCREIWNKIIELIGIKLQILLKVIFAMMKLLW